MKKLLIILSLFTFNFSFLTCEAQNWLWGRQGTTFSDNYPVAADDKGNAYLSGAFKNSISFGSQHLTSISPYNDIYLVKYDSNGNVSWADQSYSTITSACNCSSATTDESGNIYITGDFQDTVSFGADSLKSGVSSGNMFLVKLDNNGNVLWARQSFSPTSKCECSGAGVTIGSGGYVFVTGWFYDTVSFGSLVLKNTSKSVNSFLVKYDASGNVIWASQSNTNQGSDAIGLSVAADGYGDSYITGQFRDTVIYEGDTLKGVAMDFLDQYEANVLTVKYDGNGNVIWARQSIAHDDSNANNCAGNSIITDGYGGVYVTGYFLDSIRFGGINLISSEEGDAFLVKYDINGKLIWVKQSYALSKAGGGNSGYCLAKDSFNNIYLSGGAGESFVFCNDTLTLGYPDGDASMILKLDTSGNAICGSVVGAGGDDLNGIASSPSGRYVYFGGDIGDTVTFNKDFLSPDTNGEVPFMARWQPCDIPIDTLSKSVSEPCGTVFIPTAFSPNNDGENDRLYVRGKCITQMDFVVFDRWGNKVFESESLNTGWDGTYKGQPMNTGTYVWYLKATLADGTALDKKGNVELVR